jgi:hypothetical protein
MQRAFDKYGDLEYRVLAIGERDYILNIEARLRPTANVGYNHAIGGGKPPSNKGVPMSAAQKLKISLANAGKKRSVEQDKKSVATRKQRGSYLSGAANPTSKRTAQICMQTGEVVRVFETSNGVRELGYSQGNVAMVCRGERRMAYGFFWRYL